MVAVVVVMTRHHVNVKAFCEKVRFSANYVCHDQHASEKSSLSSHHADMASCL